MPDHQQARHRRAPETAPRPAIQIASKQLALSGTGGDFFEIAAHPDGSVSVLMGDVCGNGAGAALVVAALRPVARALLGEGRRPAAVLVTLNDWLVRAPEADDRFVTAVAVRLDARQRRVDIASAGHLGPFLRGRHGTARSLTFAAGVPLGMLPHQSYGNVTCGLEPDDAVVLATDGVTDALATAGDPLGEQGVLQRLIGSPHASIGICQALLADERAPRDDATVVVLQLPTAAPRAPARARRSETLPVA